MKENEKCPKCGSPLKTEEVIQLSVRARIYVCGTRVSDNIPLESIQCLRNQNAQLCKEAAEERKRRIIIDITKLHVGDKVNYQPEHYGENKWENGIVKEIRDGKIDGVWVVYNCAGNWENYRNYTSALTNLRDLKLGWIEDPTFSKETQDIVRAERDVK